MTATTEAILDAAERRIRDAGYNGFSFREVAADVGIRSASVHHHFPTKAELAVAVARRYAERFEAAVGAGPDGGGVAAWRAAFRRALREDGRMCLCGVLGAEAGALPPEVAAEARRFFERGVAQLAGTRARPSAAARDAALQTMAVLEGAMLLARVLDDPGVFDRATSGLS